MFICRSYENALNNQGVFVSFAKYARSGNVKICLFIRHNRHRINMSSTLGAGVIELRAVNRPARRRTRLAQDLEFSVRALDKAQSILLQIRRETQVVDDAARTAGAFHYFSPDFSR